MASGPAIQTLLSAAGRDCGESSRDLLCRVGAEGLSEEDRAAETLIGRPEIGDEFRVALENPAGFRTAAEKTLS